MVSRAANDNVNTNDTSSRQDKVSQEIRSRNLTEIGVEGRQDILSTRKIPTPPSDDLKKLSLILKNILFNNVSYVQMKIQSSNRL